MCGARVMRGREEKKYSLFAGKNLKKLEHLEDLGVDGSILLKWILNVYDGLVWIAFICRKIGTNCRLLRTQPFGSIKCWKFS